MKVLEELNYIFTRRQKISFVILSVLIIIGSLFELLGVAAIMPLVQIITDINQIKLNPRYRFLYELLGVKEEKQFILIMIFVLILIYMVKNIYLLIMYDCEFRFTYNNQRNVAIRLMDGYIHRDYIFHLSKNVAELQRNMEVDVGMLFGAVLSSVELLAEIFTCLFLFIYLFCIDRSITIGVVVILSIFSITYLSAAKKKSIELGHINRTSSADLNKWIRQSFEGIKEIKISNTEEFYLNKVNSIYRIAIDSVRKQRLISVLPRPLFEGISISALLFVVAIKIYRGVDLQYFIPVLSAFAVSAFRLLPSFGRVAGYINNIAYNKSAIESLYKDFMEMEEFGAATSSKNNITKVELKDRIDVENIKFSYNDGSQNVFSDASLKIKKNTSVALIGASGSGKTTLVDIILGLLYPEKGTIKVDGQEIVDNLYSWHKNIGYIPQFIYLIDDTIRNNIVFGIPDDEVDDDKVIKAIELAQLSDFINSLEKGLDTVVGERGVRLSGGQRQRIGIARALYNNPDVLILDEATSALDNATEADVMSAIDSLHGNRTLIIIAHRLTTIANCDEIYEVIDGKIISRKKEDVLNG